MKVSKFEIVSNLEEVDMHSRFFDGLFCEGGLINQTSSRSIRRRTVQRLSVVLLNRHAGKLIDKVNMVEDVEEHLEELYQEEYLIDERCDSLVI